MAGPGWVGGPGRKGVAVAGERGQRVGIVSV